MAARAMPFQAPTSLAGTLAAYEARRQSITKRDNHVPSDKDSSATSNHHEVANPMPTEAIYQRTLPSLHFLRWRPMYHLQAPNGWMNDPCAPGFDPATGLYHLFFQWNPRRNIYGAVAWGSICWGHATSYDMINWTVDGKPALKPGPWYDKEGCFTGCLVPTSLDGKPGQLTVLYTGVSRLPLHYTLPYKNSTETLAIVQSADGGSTWTKMRGNPILHGPPEGISVGGFRDPVIGPWPNMDKLLGQPQDGSSLYGMISGSLKDRTPTAFLYAVNPKNLTQWVYLNAIVDLGMNHNVSRWSGDMGMNWECANFMTLTSDVDGSSRDFIIVGGEGSKTTDQDSVFAQYPQQFTKFPRFERSLQWMSGSLHAEQGPTGAVRPKMEYVSGGKFDHGLLYAVNSFQDPKSRRQVAWGWITEEDLPQKLVDRQNWSGMLSIPRDLSLICIKGVVSALRSELKNITSLEIEPEANSAFTIRTLGISPSQSLETLRTGARVMEIIQSQRLIPGNEPVLNVQTLRFEVAAAFQVSQNCSKVGLSIFHSQDQDPASATTISLIVESETFIVERPDSSQIETDIFAFPETAPFTLFDIKQVDGSVVREQFEVRAFFDESVLEAFANGRCTHSTRVYPATKRCWGIKFWAEDPSGESCLLGAKAWDGLRANLRVS